MLVVDLTANLSVLYLTVYSCHSLCLLSGVCLHYSSSEVEYFPDILKSCICNACASTYLFWKLLSCMPVLCVCNLRMC